MNISEFERVKPTETYKSIMFCIDKYQAYISEIDPIMTDCDAISIASYQEILKDLENIKALFIRGK